MIGSQEMAAVIAAVEIVEDIDDFFCGMLPEGWHWLGSGSERHAFYGPDGVVYKRHTLTCPGQDANQREYANSLRTYMLPQDCRYARCHLWGDVLAMEYIPCDDMDKHFATIDSNVAFIELLVSGLWKDVHEDNVRTVEGTLVLIDYSR